MTTPLLNTGLQIQERRVKLYLVCVHSPRHHNNAKETREQVVYANAYGTIQADNHGE